MLHKFAVFILSHGRADNVITYRTLKDQGYTGPIYIVCDDEDTQLASYVKKYGNAVVVFCKGKMAEQTDTFDNFPEKNTVLFARNAAFAIAEDKGLEYFLVLDDDYGQFNFRYNDKLVYDDSKKGKTKNLGKVFEAVVAFMHTTSTSSIAFAQTGDYFGGSQGGMGEKIFLKRKCMNSFFLSTKRRFNYVSRLNDDVNTYITLGAVGKIFFTMNQFLLYQAPTQKQKGGLTEMYEKYGTYVKSFYSVICAPSCMSVKMMGATHQRLHHSTNWECAVPKIIRETYKKSKLA